MKKFIAVVLLAAMLVGCTPVAGEDVTTEPERTTSPTTLPTQPPETTRPEETTTEPDLPPKVLERFSELLEENELLVGWINVPNTVIDYPVVYCEDNEYYLKHDFWGEDDPDGTIFLTKEADLLENNQSLSLFGHHRKNGLMFSGLHKFKTLRFYKETPVFSFDSLYEEADYKIFSVFYMAGNSSDEYFYYYPKASFKTDEDFMEHVKQLKNRSIFNLAVDVEAGDQIVLMTCCTYETENLRIVVAGRKVREGESAEVDVQSATVNPSPLYPKKWYDKFGGKAPALD